MARLNVDLTAIEIAELLNAGKRNAAKALIIEKLATGTARAETQRLAAQVFRARKGRAPTGPYKWIEIGRANYWLEVEGVPFADRLNCLEELYGRGNKHIEACITLYNKGIEAGRDPS